MKEQLVIHLSDQDAPACWVLVDEKGDLGGPASCGELGEASALAAKRQVRILVPGADVLLTEVDVNTRQVRQLLQAAPYALEEALAEDPEQLHFAVHGGRQAHGYPVAVVSRERMEDWLARLDAAGIQPDSLEPDVLAVPTGDQPWSAMRLNGTTLLRTGEFSGLACENALFPTLLDALADDSEAPPARLHCAEFGGRDGPVDTAGTRVELSMEPGGDLADGIGRLARSLGSVPRLNLLQGDYDRSGSVRRAWRPWIPALVLLGLWAALHIGFSLWQYQGTGRELAAVDAEIASLVKADFPDAQNIPKGKERNFFVDALADLGGGAADAGFLGLLAAAGDTIRQVPKVNMEGLSYRQGVMQLSLDIPDLQVLDQLKQQLVNHAGLQVDIQGATAQEGRVKARLRILGATP